MPNVNIVIMNSDNITDLVRELNGFGYDAGNDETCEPPEQSVAKANGRKNAISEKELGAMLKNALDFIEYMVLYNKIMLQDIPAETRLLSSGIYIYAFRVSRNISKERYINDLATLKSDIEKCADRDKAYLQHIYEDYYENTKYIKVG